MSRALDLAAIARIKGMYKSGVVSYKEADGALCLLGIQKELRVDMLSAWSNDVLKDITKNHNKKKRK